MVDRRSFFLSFFRNYDSINGGEEKFSRECGRGEMGGERDLVPFYI